MVGVGRLIDRFSAIDLIPLMLVPLGGALLILATLDAPWAVVVYLAVLGIGTGVQFPLLTAVWPELYGVRYIGSVKSMLSAVSVLVSALGPVAMGAMMDGGFGGGGNLLPFRGLLSVERHLALSRFENVPDPTCEMSKRRMGQPQITRITRIRVSRNLTILLKTW